MPVHADLLGQAHREKGHPHAVLLGVSVALGERTAQSVEGTELRLERAPRELGQTIDQPRDQWPEARGENTHDQQNTHRRPQSPAADAIDDLVRRLEDTADPTDPFEGSAGKGHRDQQVGLPVPSLDCRPALEHGGES